MSTLARHGAKRPITRLRVTDDILTGESLRCAERLAGEPGGHQLHLDLAGVRIPTAAGLGALVRLHHNVRSRGGHLVLMNVQPWAYEVFQVARLTEVLDVRGMGSDA